MLEDWFKNSKDLSDILEEYRRIRKELSAITDIIFRNFFKLSE